VITVHGPPIRLLLVEDDPEDARSLRQRLGGSDSPSFQTAWARSLGEAERAVTEAAFDALLLDLSLPGGTDLELLAWARNAAPSTPVIVLTGSEDPEVGDRAVRAGAQECLVKNRVPGDSLARVVRHSIERARQQEDRRARASGGHDVQLRRAAEDLRIPLTNILLGLETILRRKGESDPEGRTLAMVQREASRLNRRIADLLEAVRLKARRAPVRLEACPVAELIAEVQAAFGPDSGPRGIRVHADVPEGLPPVWTDRRQLKQVLSHLFVAAAGVAPQDRSVTLRAEPDGPFVRVRLAHTHRVPPEDEPSHRSGESRKPIPVSSTHEEDLGPDLATAERIVRAQGGRHWVEHGEGGGRIFHLLLPAV
jgi:phosphoserine phosphatase RsbU/P